MAKSYRGLRKQYDNLPEAVRTYLGHLDGLLDGSDRYEIALAYIFMKLEEGHHRALKCGLVRLHKCNSAKVDEALQEQHFVRKSFKTIFKNVIGKPIQKAAADKLVSAEAVRDKQIHGKTVTSSDLRQAISDALFYIEAMGNQIDQRTGKNPFGDLRGLAGKTKLLDATTSYWILRGVGLYTKNDKEDP
ncbi:MAG: hypothetical protein AAFP16_10440 [Pseudomonadota bacterium]